MLIIYAVNIHTGGGKVLLDALVQELDTETLVYCDARYSPALKNDKISYCPVEPKMIARLRAEFNLASRVSRSDVAVFFGNLPPLRKFSCRTILFFQNMILIEDNGIYEFGLKRSIKHFIESLWIRWGLKNIDEIIVQTETVRQAFLRKFPTAKIRIAPFLPAIKAPSDAPRTSSHDFIYVSSGDPHKNHAALLDAWQILRGRGVAPSLALTLQSTDTELLRRIEKMSSEGCKIKNYAGLDHGKVVRLYSQSSALIYPSFTESFGIPLLEAKRLGLPIVASELDYVRELVDPAQSFDPCSAISIASAVERHLGIGPTKEPILSPLQFLELISKGGK